MRAAALPSPAILCLSSDIFFLISWTVAIILVSAVHIDDNQAGGGRYTKNERVLASHAKFYSRAAGLARALDGFMYPPAAVDFSSRGSAHAQQYEINVSSNKLQAEQQ
jgi:hypothetical protein